MGLQSRVFFVCFFFVCFFGFFFYRSRLEVVDVMPVEGEA